MWTCHNLTLPLILLLMMQNLLFLQRTSSANVAALWCPAALHCCSE